MRAIGDVHVFVHDFTAAMTFYSTGLELEVIEKEVSDASAYALLEFPDGGPAIRLFAGVDPWAEGERPELGSRPTVRFDLLTSDFDDTLVRLLEHGGQQVGEIESYNDLRGVTIADPDGNTFELLETVEEFFTGDGSEEEE